MCVFSVSLSAVVEQSTRHTLPLYLCVCVTVVVPLLRLSALTYLRFSYLGSFSWGREHSSFQCFFWQFPFTQNVTELITPKVCWSGGAFNEPTPNLNLPSQKSLGVVYGWKVKFLLSPSYFNCLLQLCAHTHNLSKLTSGFKNRHDYKRKLYLQQHWSFSGKYPHKRNESYVENKWPPTT